MNAEEFLAGPRGRRMLLEFASISERTLHPDYSNWKLIPAIADASYQLDPGRGTSTVRMSIGGTNAEDAAEATPQDIASILNSMPLVDVTVDALIETLSTAVDTAMYWQKPDGEDVLAADPVVTNALRRIAEYVLASSLSHWFHSGFDPRDQWQVELLLDDVSTAPILPAVDVLKNDRTQAIASEARAAAERPAEITANWSGAWWSIPPTLLPSSSRRVNGTPAGLLFVEDSLGSDLASVRQLRIPGNTRVYAIDSAESWAVLCRKYPRVVTHEKRHDWYRTTGRDGAWVVPDWTLVAADYDGVHLTIAGYLSSAGVAIPLDDETASVIAGWNPDQTWWLRDMESQGDDVFWEWDQEEGWIHWSEDE